MNKWEKLRTFGTTTYIDIDTGEILKDWNKLKEYYCIIVTGKPKK